MKAYQLMSIKYTTVAPDTSPEEIAHLLGSGRIDNVLVVDQHQQVIGIVHATNVRQCEQVLGVSGTSIVPPARVSPHPGQSYGGDTGAQHLTTADSMIRDIECVDVDDNASDVLWLMNQHDLQIVLVLANSQVVGTISRGDKGGYLPREKVRMQH